MGKKILALILMISLVSALEVEKTATGGPVLEIGEELAIGISIRIAPKNKELCVISIPSTVPVKNCLKRLASINPSKSQ